MSILIKLLRPWLAETNSDLNYIKYALFIWSEHGGGGAWELKLKATVTESAAKLFITEITAHEGKVVSRTACNESHKLNPYAPSVIQK